ncbi:hypothetical protein NG696_04950 [Pseudarthrobacter sp. HLT1-5]|nr:hypothetical protein [Pseudarthrobacter sp. HLT1-5]
MRRPDSLNAQRRLHRRRRPSRRRRPVLRLPRATLPAVVQSVNKDRQCNMVCSREPGQMVCAHLRAGHGFTISAADYELW